MYWRCPRSLKYVFPICLLILFVYKKFPIRRLPTPTDHHLTEEEISKLLVSRSNFITFFLPLNVFIFHTSAELVRIWRKRRIPLDGLIYSKFVALTSSENINRRMHLHGPYIGNPYPITRCFITTCTCRIIHERQSWLLFQLTWIFLPCLQTK